jgi:ParB/RepB/Spo0J family partition protein
MPDVKGITSLPVADLSTNGNVRVDASASPALVASVLQHGVIQPIVVRNTDDGWTVIAGHRRLNAAIEAKQSDVPVRVIVGRKLSDADVIGMQVAENLHRKELSSYELAQAAWDLKLDGLKQADVAAQMGVSTKDVSALQKIGKAFNADADLKPELAAELGTQALLDIVESEKSPAEMTRLIVEENMQVYRAEKQVEVDEASIVFYEELVPLIEQWSKDGVQSTSQKPERGQRIDPDAATYIGDVLRVPLKEHLQEPCHIIWVYENQTSGPGIQHWCLTPNKHMKVDAAVEVTGADEIRKAKAVRSVEAKTNREEKQLRRTQLAAWKPKRTDIRVWAQTELVRQSFREDQVRVACTILDLDKERVKGSEYDWYNKRLKKWFKDSKLSDEGIEAFKVKIILGTQFIEKQWPLEEVVNDIEGKKK